MSNVKTTAKGWKIFNKDLKCRNYQFEIGKTYTQEGELQMCGNGFHFHENEKDLFEYYDFIPENRVCEVECQNVITGDNKSVCSTIKLVKELSWNEVLNLINLGVWNTGRLNSGNFNSGNYNSGDYNSGDYNSGNRNSGDRNSGNRNSGDRNSGDHNSGNRNSGDRNSGYRNSGNYNSGYFNSTNYSSGLFNSEEQKVPLFNGAAYVIMSEFRNTDKYHALFDADFPLTEWISESDMTDEEKKDYPKFFVQGGYLKKRKYKEACAIWWDNTSKRCKKLIQEIDGFDKDIFFEITGIKL